MNVSHDDHDHNSPLMSRDNNGDHHHGGGGGGEDDNHGEGGQDSDYDSMFGSSSDISAGGEDFHGFDATASGDGDGHGHGHGDSDDGSHGGDEDQEDDDYLDMFGGSKGSGEDDDASSSVDATGNADDDAEGNKNVSQGEDKNSISFVTKNPSSILRTSTTSITTLTESMNQNGMPSTLSSPPAIITTGVVSATGQNHDSSLLTRGDISTTSKDKSESSINHHNANMSIPRKRKASTMMQSSMVTTMSSNTSNQTEDLVISSSHPSSTSKFPSSRNKTISTTGTTKPSVMARSMRPDQYKSYDMEDFWRSLRSWDFLMDLNSSMNRAPQGQSQGQGRDYQGNGKGGSDDDEQTPKGHRSSLTSKTQQQPLPDKFHCHEQYIALWAPLLTKETKAQILSEISSTTASVVPWSKMISPVKVVAKDKPSSSLAAMGSECLMLEISSRTAAVSKMSTAGRDAGGTSGRSRGGGGAVMPHSASSSFIDNPAQADFLPNDLVLITCDPSIVDQASKGVLKVPDKPSSYSVTSLLSLASPFVDRRLAIVGVVAQRSRSLGTSGTLLVQVSRRLWKSSSVGIECDLFIARLGNNVTAMREFRALCKMNEMSLSTYLLEPKFDHHVKPSGKSSDSGGGSNALGIGFRIWVKSKFNQSQQASINAATREYGDGGFTLIKGPPGTGKTTTLVALLNALHLRQYQKYYSEIERITLSAKASSQTETLAAISAAAKVKPRILVCAPSNAAVDNVCQKIMDDRFLDGNGSKYSPPMIRIGSSAAVGSLTLNQKVNKIISQGSNPKQLEAAMAATRTELKRLQNEVRNLQLRIRLIAKASLYPLSREWEIRIDEENFEINQRVLYVNHKTKKVQLKCPPRLAPGEEEYPIDEMPHYRGCMVSLVKYIERHNDMHSKLLQFILLQNAAADLQSSKTHSDVTFELNQQLETNVLDSTHLVMTTLGSSGSKMLDSVEKFSVVVIDEAAQCSEPSMLPALHRGSSHCVLLGDPAQLPATIFEVSGRETKYDRSLFQRLEEAGHPVYMLNTQYRMHPKISSFPRRIFYQGGLVDGPNVCKPSYGGDLSMIIKSKFRHFQPFTMFDLDSTEERDGTNLSNTSEAQLALYLYQNLDKETNGLAKKSRMAVITPYLQQVSLIKRLFEEKYGLSYRQFLDISTIDSFQGKESSIVILSCVRAATPCTYDDENKRGSGGIGFLSDVQRMNVALTRAKHFLFVITRCRTILVNPYWRDLIGHAYAQQAILKVTPHNNGGGESKSLGRSRNSSANNRVLFPDLRNLRPISDLSGGHGFHKYIPDNI